MPFPPPPARREPVEVTTHGDTRVDEYGWLADETAPEVLAHLAAENDYAAASTHHLAGLRERLFRDIVARTVTDDVSVPVRLGPWWYYTRTRDGAQYPVYARSPVVADEWDPPAVRAGVPLPGEEVFLDGNDEARDLPFFGLGAVAVSADHNLLAYSVDDSGDERFTVRVKDLRTGELAADEVPGAFYGVVWGADSAHFYYTVVDDAWRPHEVRRHVLGTPVTDDETVLVEHDERFWLGVDLSTSRRYLLIGAGSRSTSEYHLLDLADPGARPVLVAERRDGVEYDVDHVRVGAREQLLIVHNGPVESGSIATDFAVAVASTAEPAAQHWHTVLLPPAGVRVLGASAVAGDIVVSLRRDGIARVLVLPVLEAETTPAVSQSWPEVGVGWEVPFDEQLFTAEFDLVPDPQCPYVRLAYSSFVTPSTVYDLDPTTRELLLRKQTEVRGVDVTAFDSHREWARASDGTLVPISVVYRRGTRPDGRNPVLLYGYGSYETSIDPAFVVSRLALLERGVVYAVAHVRGGGELGRNWYEAGRLDEKATTFTDFVSCVEHLVALGWADPQRVVASGASAGGLLMGAVANLAPERFAGVLAGVPFVDALTTMLDPSLPLTVIEREEWGDPLADQAAYDYIKSYAPYEQVADRAYPPILAITSLHDTRVRYVEPAKWVARLRERAPHGGPYLLKTELDGGHGGASGRYSAWRDRAYELAWILDRLGLAD